MPKYTITKVFVVEAASKAEAQAKVTADPEELLEFLRVAEATQPKAEPKPAAGWRTTLVTQLTGK
jgi:hypothetical protein